MAFTDNPAISAMLTASGLGGLTSTPSSSPIGALAQPANPLAPPTSMAPADQLAQVASNTMPDQPRVSVGKSAPNMPEYRTARFFDPRQPGGAGRSAGGGAPVTEPGALSPDVQNNPTVMDLLNHFGVHPLQQIDPGLFIHNADAWRNHPVMSGVLDGLLGGLANTSGGDTVGESISNVAKGLQATGAQRTAHINAQLQAPFSQAMTVAQLQDQVQGQQFKQDEATKNRAQASYYDALPGIKAAEDQSKLAVAQERSRGMLQRQQAHDSVVAKLPDPAKDVYQKSYNANLARITGNRDLTTPGQEATADEQLAAGNEALKDAVTTPAVTKAVTISHDTLPDKEAVAGTGAGIRQSDKVPPEVKAEYDQANEAYKEATKPGLKVSDRAALAGSSRHYLTPGDPEWTAYAQKVKQRLDAATAALARHTPQPSTQAPVSNPYRR